jgi:isocitrate dehydrogenase kinase/phosphatase
VEGRIDRDLAAAKSLGFEPHLKDVFLESHGEILTADRWRGIQHWLRDGELLEVLPYHSHRVRVFSSL